MPGLAATRPKEGAVPAMVWRITQGVPVCTPSQDLKFSPHVAQEADREVSKSDGIDLARAHGCLFVETSAKANIAVQQAFQELVLKVLDTPELLATAGGVGPGLGLQGGQGGARPGSSCCG